MEGVKRYDLAPQNLRDLSGLRYDRMIRGTIYKNKTLNLYILYTLNIIHEVSTADRLTFRQLRVFCTVARLLSYTRVLL